MRQLRIHHRMTQRIPVALTLLLTCVLAGCGSGNNVTQSRTTSTPTTTTTIAMTTASDEAPPATCSAPDSPVQLANETDVPAPVADTRRRILVAAQACDFDALQKIVDEHPDQFQYQVGVSTVPSQAAAYWRSHDTHDQLMGRLVQLLTTPSAVLAEGVTKTYVWPAVHAGHRADADWQALIDSGAYSEQEVGAMRTEDLYVGYRVGILPDGTWTYFVAGD